MGAGGAGRLFKSSLCVADRSFSRAGVGSGGICSRANSAVSEQVQPGGMEVGLGLLLVLHVAEGECTFLHCSSALKYRPVSG